MKSVKINGKYKIKLLDHRAKFYEDHPDWEKERFASMRKHINKHDVVYYIGAEQGEIPALLQLWGAKVCVFEPNQKQWPSIRKTFEINKLKRPEGLFAFFVGAETEMTPKNPDKDLNGGSGWVLDDDNWPVCSKGEVLEESTFSELHNEKDALPVASIDDVASHAFGPTALCIDVEGSEYEVLKGAENTLLTYQPKIWLSIHPDFLRDYWNTTANEVLKWLHDRGYECELLADVHERHYLCTVK